MPIWIRGWRLGDATDTAVLPVSGSCEPSAEYRNVEEAGYGV